MLAPFNSKAIRDNPQLFRPDLTQNLCSRWLSGSNPRQMPIWKTGTNAPRCGWNGSPGSGTSAVSSLRRHRKALLTCSYSAEPSGGFRHSPSAARRISMPRGSTGFDFLYFLNAVNSASVRVAQIARTAEESQFTTFHWSPSK